MICDNPYYSNKQLARQIFDNEHDLGVYFECVKGESKQPNLERQYTQSCAYMTKNFKSDFLSLNLSTSGMFSVE